MAVNEWVINRIRNVECMVFDIQYLVADVLMIPYVYIIHDYGIHNFDVRTFLAVLAGQCKHNFKKYTKYSY